MDCKRATQAMNEALDTGRTGRLPKDVQAHLAGCAMCRRSWQELLALETGLGEAAHHNETAPFPASLHRRIMTAVHKEQRRPGSERHAWRGGMARRMLAAAALLLIVVSAGLVNRKPHLVVITPDPATQNGDDNPSKEFPITIDLTEWIGNPKQDLKELASAILSTTSAVIDIVALTRPAASATPQATPNI